MECRTEGDWRGVIIAEAATVFRRNKRKSIQMRRTTTFERAKEWVEAEVKALLHEEEEISQAMVVMGDNVFELCPSSWGGTPLWRNMS